MNLTNFYDNRSFRRAVNAGRRIVSQSEAGSEAQRFEVGDIVDASECCTLSFRRAKIIEVYKQNGYYYYICQFGKCTKTCRAKDLQITNK